jgi:hypothetical protein
VASVSTLRIPWCVSLCAETSARSTEICVFICVDVAGVEPRLKLDCLTWEFVGGGVEGLGPGVNMLTVPRVFSVANRSGTAFRTGPSESHSTSRDELLRSFSPSAERVAKYEMSAAPTPSPSAPTAPFPSVVVPSCVAAPNPSAAAIVAGAKAARSHNANRTDRTNKTCSKRSTHVPRRHV